MSPPMLWGMEMIEAKGRTGRVTFDGKMVTFYREGVGAMLQGGKGSKSVPLRSIGAVHFKPGGVMANGAWGLSITGEAASSRAESSKFKSAQAAARDENAVVVTRGQNAQFEALTAAINSALADL